MSNNNTLQDIIKRLKLKYKIVRGTLYAIIEDNRRSNGPHLRPASDEEMYDIQDRESAPKIKEMLKKYKKKEPVNRNN